MQWCTKIDIYRVCSLATAQCATWFNWVYTQSEPKLSVDTNLLLFSDGVQNWKHHWSTAFLNRQSLAHIYKEGICGIILDFETIFNCFTMTNCPNSFFTTTIWLNQHICYGSYLTTRKSTATHSIVHILVPCITSHKHLVSMVASKYKVNYIQTLLIFSCSRDFIVYVSGVAHSIKLNAYLMWRIQTNYQVYVI